ncbi:23S rRNA (pseudouridine(1915)-N(3))-methyltransferase RlmH [Congregibacter sp.]|uniref:23S rRNA (pseudouridine(1915)-N(3))-methyltransferase RlmH n=1 Tax=Congregibacter sp. TaxID=2744308 RepID=UPI003F6BA86C
MRVNVHSVAGKMPRWVDTAVAEYEKRLPRELKLHWREVPLAARSTNSNAEQLKEREGAAMLKGVSSSDHCVALDGRGKPWTTEELAKQMEQWMMQGQDLSLLIGGPDGLSDACLAASKQRWSLGPLTLPHPLVRVVLAEQLYRAWTITIGHPYHRP